MPVVPAHRARRSGRAHPLACRIRRTLQPLALLAALTLATATAVATEGVRRSEQTYQVPHVKVLTAEGRARPKRQLLDDGRPVVMTFMYSSCTTVCPVTSHVLDEFVRALGSDARRVNVVSVSIDPDHDTVTRLAEHARARGSQGTFVTGDPQSAEAVQRAFDAWRGDKMNHDAVIFLRAPASPVWVRLDGLVSPRRLLDEYRRLQPA